jgi:hypothetical protein
MHKIINGIGEQIRTGEHFEHLHESSDTLEDYTVFFRKFEKKHYREYLGYARWFYQGNNFPALQCVWPDAAHRYPWHPDFNQNLVGRQPVFGEDNSWPFHDGKNRAAFTTRTGCRFSWSAMIRTVTGSSCAGQPTAPRTHR